MAESRALIVCRPQPGARRTARALAAAGWAAQAKPMLYIEPLPESPELRTRIQALDAYAAVVFVSAAAVEHGMPWVDRFWPALPVYPRWVAVGASTRQALAHWGIDAAAPADERSEGMLALPELTRAQGERVLIVRGAGGRGWLAEQLRAAGTRVDFLEVYRRQPVTKRLPPEHEIRGFVVSSVAVLEALCQNVTERYRQVPLIVPSSRVADAAQRAGFGDVTDAGGADDDATCRAVAARFGNGEVGRDCR